MSDFRWGIFGTGAISAKFVAGLSTAESASASFVASRTASRAEAFRLGAGIDRAIVGYAEAAAAGGVDAVYVATPATHHVEHALACIEAGIPVLVEKPFALTGPDARRVADAAAAHGVFAMEAMWTRFLPAATELRARFLDGAVGDPRVVAGSFGVSQVPSTRASMFDPSLGGGALSHLAPYPLSLAQWLLGTATSVQATGVVGSSGVDETVVMTTRHAGDVLGSFHVSLRSWAPDDFRVLGSHGSLGLRGSVVRPHGLDLSREAPRDHDQLSFGTRARLRQHPVVHAVAQRVDRSTRGSGRRRSAYYAGNGYHYEADEVRACVRDGRLESGIMPLSDSVAVAETIDLVRGAVARADLAGGPR